MIVWKKEKCIHKFAVTFIRTLADWGQGLNYIADAIESPLIKINLGLLIGTVTPVSFAQYIMLMNISIITHLLFPLKKTLHKNMLRKLPSVTKHKDDSFASGLSQSIF